MQLNPMDYKNTTKKVEMVRAHTSTARRHTRQNSIQGSDWETKQENKRWPETHLAPSNYQRPRYLNIDLQKAIKLSKDRYLYNEMVVDRVKAKSVDNYRPEHGDPENAELTQDRVWGRQKRKDDEDKR